MSLNSIMDLLSAPQAAGARQQIGQQLGLDEASTAKAIQALLPALAAGLASNAQKPGGVEALVGALTNGQHERYLDQPESLGRLASLADGKAILGHLLGSKDMSRAVAGAAAKKTGLSDELLKTALPMVATMVMGQLARGTKDKQAQSANTFGLEDLMGMIGGASGSQQADRKQAGGGLMGMLGGMLDKNKDGSAVDDIFNMVMKSRK